jgi:hypothetical protein
MDPLALLSNLHGDGPATLQRLRRHGCDTLTLLLASSAGELAPILGWEPTRAERFQREADVLMRRLGDGILDVEEDASEPIAPEPRRPLHDLAADDDAADDGDEGEEEPEEDAEEEMEDVPLSEQVREEVLARWRTLDATEPMRTPDTLVPHTPSAPLAAPGHPLTGSGIDGLDPVRLRALQSAGITTLEELSTADDFELHRASRLPFTLVSRLTFLARRTAAKTAPKPVRQPAPRPVVRGDAAGPFA